MPWGVQSPTTVDSCSVQNWKLASDHNSVASFRKKKGLVLFLSTVQKHIYCFVEVMWTSCYHCPQVWRTMFLESFVGQKGALGLAPTVRGEQRGG